MADFTLIKGQLGNIGAQVSGSPPPAPVTRPRPIAIASVNTDGTIIYQYGFSSIGRVSNNVGDYILRLSNPPPANIGVIPIVTPNVVSNFGNNIFVQVQNNAFGDHGAIRVFTRDGDSDEPSDHIDWPFFIVVDAVTTETVGSTGPAGPTGPTGPAGPAGSTTVFGDPTSIVGNGSVNSRLYPKALLPKFVPFADDGINTPFISLADAPPGTPINLFSADENATLASYRKARANDMTTTVVVGLILGISVWVPTKRPLISNGHVELSTDAWDEITGQTGGLTPGAVYYLSSGTAGQLTTTPPSAPNTFITQVGVALENSVLLVQIGAPVVNLG